jgi:hypothetical protein
MLFAVPIVASPVSGGWNVGMCVYVCMGIYAVNCTYVCVCMYVTLLQPYLEAAIYSRTMICVCMFAYIYIYIYIYICFHIHTCNFSWQWPDHKHEAVCVWVCRETKQSRADFVFTDVWISYEIFLSALFERTFEFQMNFFQTPHLNGNILKRLIWTNVWISNEYFSNASFERKYS